VMRRESDEIDSRRRKEPSRLQERTSAAGSRTSLPTLNWHEWNSCPSRWFFAPRFSFREEWADSCRQAERSISSNREGHEFIRAGDGSSGFEALAAGVELSRSGREGETSAAESRMSLPTLNWHEWNSCPSQLFFTSRFSFWEKRADSWGHAETSISSNREGHEFIRANDRSSGFEALAAGVELFPSTQGEPSAAESRTSLPTLNWHEWNLCPSWWFFTREFLFWERANG
jgi:hypothetical protein